MARRELTPFALVVLGLLLQDGPQHPYEILRTMRKHHDDLRLPVSVGSIYRAVERLEREGYAEAVGTEREGARPERTTYAVTDAGRDEHRRRTSELLRTVEREYPAFDVGLGQADALDGREVADLLRERLAAIETEHAALRAGMDVVVARGVPRRFLLDAFYELDLRAAQAGWIRRTIDEIESGELDWTEPLPAALADRTAHPAAPAALPAPAAGATPQAHPKDAA